MPATTDPITTTTATTTAAAAAVPLRPATSRAPGPPRRRAHRLRRWLARIAIAAALAGAVAVGVRAWLPDPVPVDVAVARRTKLVVAVEADGKTRIRDRTIVAAPAAGELERIALEPGDRVTRGARIAVIRALHPALLDRRSRAEAEAASAAATARERQTRTAVTRAAAAADAADRDAARARTLADRAAITASELDHTELARTLAHEDLAAAEQQARAAAAELRRTRAVLGARGAGDAAIEVVAPFTGTVLRVARDDAGPIATGAPLLELGDPATTEVVVDVLSVDAARLVPGTPATIAAWGGEPIAGRVRQIEPAATTQISALGIEEQRVDVLVTLDRVPPALGDGFRVEAALELWSRHDVLAIPIGALFRDRGAWAVYVVTGDTVALRRVEVGHRNADLAEVTGIEPGEQVVVHPSDRVTPGAEVTAR
jgi:HlyD family secretion protein